MSIFLQNNSLTKHNNKGAMKNIKTNFIAYLLAIITFFNVNFAFAMQFIEVDEYAKLSDSGYKYSAAVTLIRKPTVSQGEF